MPSQHHPFIRSAFPGATLQEIRLWSASGVKEPACSRKVAGFFVEKEPLLSDAAKGTPYLIKPGSLVMDEYTV